MTKTCSHCGETKPLSAFKEAGRKATCKVCDAARSKEYRKANKNLINERRRERVKQNPAAHEKKLAMTRAWRNRKRQELGGSLYSLYQKYTYGLTPEKHKDLCEAYPVCGICGRDTHMKTDHCHKTGKVRGRLCTGCNTAMGRLGDDIPGLLRAIEYLANPRF